VTGRTKGVGLGLAIAKRIVEQHGGRIRARNHPEGGAELEITIPAKGA
jgi:two-component system sensor histidine kinase HupT/HoxJ